MVKNLSSANSTSFLPYSSVFIVYREKTMNMPSRINPIALRKAKIAYNFGLSECSRVKRLKISIFVDGGYFEGTK